MGEIAVNDTPEGKVIDVEGNLPDEEIKGLQEEHPDAELNLRKYEPKRFAVWDIRNPREDEERPIEKTPSEMKEFVKNLGSEKNPFSKEDGLERGEEGKRVEKTGLRKADETYSSWHRTLSNWCYVTDIDWLEYRDKNGELIPVAILETKQWHVTERKHFEDNANFKAIKKVADMIDVPFYVVWIDIQSIPVLKPNH